MIIEAKCKRRARPAQRWGPQFESSFHESCSFRPQIRVCPLTPEGSGGSQVGDLGWWVVASGIASSDIVSVFGGTAWSLPPRCAPKSHWRKKPGISAERDARQPPSPPPPQPPQPPPAPPPGMLRAVSPPGRQGARPRVHTPARACPRLPPARVPVSLSRRAPVAMETRSAPLGRPGMGGWGGGTGAQPVGKMAAAGPRAAE